MKVRGWSLFVSAVLALLATACSNSAATTTVVPPVTIAPVTTTVPPTTTSITTTTIPAATTTLPGNTVGNPAALEALIDRVVEEEVGAVNVGGRENVPVPAINVADPIEAFRSIVSFEDWVLKTYADPAWAEVLGVPDSEGFRGYRSTFDSLASDGVRWVDRGDPYEVFDFVQLEITDLPGVPPSDFAPPPGSLAFTHDSSKGPYDVVRIASGEVVDSRPGWTSVRLVVVLSPTGLGWQVYYTEVLP